MLMPTWAKCKQAMILVQRSWPHRAPGRTPTTAEGQILGAIYFEKRAGKGSTRDDKKRACARTILARSAW